MLSNSILHSTIADRSGYYGRNRHWIRVIEMDKEIMDFPLYGKIYNHLQSVNGRKLFLSQLYNEIENVKINVDDMKMVLTPALLELGMTPRQADQVLSYVCHRFRFSRTDTKKIVRNMRQLGYFEYHRGGIIEFKRD